jgi:hypothetical protein
MQINHDEKKAHDSLLSEIENIEEMESKSTPEILWRSLQASELKTLY